MDGAVVIVEGVSDRAALEALARRRGRDLAAEGVSVLAIGGAHRIARVLEELGPHGTNARLAGLVDVGEARIYQQALQRAGLGARLTRSGMEELGFYTCDRDLEDELIRALGSDTVEEIIDARAERVPWETFCKQPAQRGRPVEERLHRFLGTRSGRKELYARLLVDALPLDQVPRPLDGVLGHV
jgi:hypothetical protein